MTEYAEIIAQLELHKPARVREWIGPDGTLHPVSEEINPVAMLTEWGAKGWELVAVCVYYNLRIYTLRRDRTTAAV